MGSNSQELVLIIRAKNLASKAIRSVGTDMGQLGTKTGGFNNALVSVGQFGVKALAGVGVATAAVAAIAVKSFANFEDEMNKSLAIMGNVPQEMQDNMSNAARAIAKETRIGANEAAESYFFLASAGLDAEQSIAALPQVAAFAQAGMFDMARATDLATDAQSALGLTVEDPIRNLENLTRVTDVLVKGNTLANASVEQFSESLTNKAGAALKVVNKDIEEGVAVLAAFADQGIKGAEAGTALNIVMRDLQTKAIKNKEEFKAMNVEVFDSNGKMKNLGDIVGDLEVGLEGMSDEQKKATLAQLGFNDKSVIFIQTLLGTSEKIKQYESDLRDAGGTTQEVADKQMESLKAQFDLVGSAAQDMMIGLGEKLGPAIKEDLVPALMLLIDTTGMYVEAIGPVLIGAIKFAADALVAMQYVVLDFIGIWDDEARRKAKQIVLNRELAQGLGEGLPPAKRLAAAMITLGKEGAWTEEGLKSLIATTGASALETERARQMVLDHAEAVGWDQKWIDMLNDSTSDATAISNAHFQALKEEEQQRFVNRLQIMNGVEALDDEAAAYEEVEEAIEDTTAARQEHLDVIRMASDPMFAAIKNLQSMAAAQERVDQLVNDGKGDTEEYAEAMLELAEATLGAQDGLDDIDPTALEGALGTIGAAMGASDEQTRDFLETLGILDGKQIAVVLDVEAPVIQYSSSGNTYTPNKTLTKHFAQGGFFERGDFLRVGEDGEELLLAGVSGAIVSNPATPGGNFNDFFPSQNSQRDDANPTREIRDVHLHLHGVDLSEGSRHTLMRIREGLRDLDQEAL